MLFPGYDQAMESAEVVKFLKKMTTAELLAATATAPCTIVIDGEVIPGPPRDLYLSGQIQKVDLLLGFNADEGYMFLPYFGVLDLQVTSLWAWQPCSIIILIIQKDAQMNQYLSVMLLLN